MTHNHHDHDHEGISCGCHNPILKLLGRKFVLANLPPGKQEKSVPEPAWEKTLLFHDGQIRTLANGKENELYDSMLIQNGKVLIVGTLVEVKNYASKFHIRVDDIIGLGHKFVLPGFVEPHVHIIVSALCNSLLSVGGINMNEQHFIDKKYDRLYIKAVIDDYIRRNKQLLASKDWILAFGLDPAFMAFIEDDKGTLLLDINRKFMQGLNATYPLAIEAPSTHTLYVNDKAMHLIFEAKSEKGDESFVKNYPTEEEFMEKIDGKLNEDQQKWAFEAMPPPQLESLVKLLPKAMQEVFDKAAEKGFTFLYDAGMDADQKKIFDECIDKGLVTEESIKLRFGCARSVSTNEDVEKLPSHWPTVPKPEEPDPKEYHFFYTGHVKFVSDGSNQGLTGLQSEPYKGVSGKQPEAASWPGAFGIANLDADGLKKLVYDILFKGWPLMLHANGNTAVTAAIEDFKLAIDEITKEIIDGKDKAPVNADGKKVTLEDLKKLRNRIEHCSIFTEEEKQLSDMQKYGLSPSFTIGHVSFWGNTFKNLIFTKDKAEKMLLCKSALDKGIRISLNSDYCVSPLGPLRLMEQSITRIIEKSKDNATNTTRKTEQKEVFNAKQLLTPMQALKAVTIDAAWNCNADQWVGSLEPGKFADFVILETDPLTMESDDIYLNMRAIPVLETWVGGEQVYPNKNVSSLV